MINPRKFIGLPRRYYEVIVIYYYFAYQDL